MDNRINDELELFDALPEYPDYTVKIFRRKSGKVCAEVVHETDEEATCIGCTLPRTDIDQALDDARKKIDAHRKSSR